MPRQATLNFTSQSMKHQSRLADKAATPLIESRDSALASIEDVAPVSSQNTEPPHCTPLTMDSSYDIPDSTDWLNTPLSSFEPLEAALRCQVCKEFYDTPMITVCSHTFCSLCIRRCITTDGKCPTCKKGNQADKLMPNWVVGEIVERFVKARPTALELVRKNNEVNAESGKKKKRKLDDTDLEDEISVKETRSRKTRSRSRAAGFLQSDPIEVLDSDDGDEYVPDGMVKCPICQNSMKEEQVFLHLDTCNAQPSQGRSTRSRTNNSFPPQRQPQKAPSPAPTRLPQMNYALMKDGALRQKFQQLGIPAWGSKTVLIKRHTEWLNLWNSNVDSSHPKSKTQLLRDLDTWERTQGGSVPASKPKVMEKDFDGHQWISENKDHFSDLVANARKKREVPEEQNETPKEQNGEIEGSQDTELKEDQITEVKEDPPRPELPSQQSEEPQSSSIPAAETISHPYEDNNAALNIIRDKVEHASLDNESAILPMRIDAASNRPSEGVPNPFVSPSRKMPMFQLSEDPVVDVEQSTKI